MAALLGIWKNLFNLKLLFKQYVPVSTYRPWLRPGKLLIISFDKKLQNTTPQAPLFLYEHLSWEPGLNLPNSGFEKLPKNFENFVALLSSWSQKELQKQRDTKWSSLLRHGLIVESFFAVLCCAGKIYLPAFRAHHFAPPNWPRMFSFLASDVNKVWTSLFIFGQGET